jgi:hypothetical protein
MPGHSSLKKLTFIAFLKGFFADVITEQSCESLPERKAPPSGRADR